MKACAPPTQSPAESNRPQEAIQTDHSKKTYKIKGKKQQLAARCQRKQKEENLKTVRNKVLETFSKRISTWKKSNKSEIKLPKNIRVTMSLPGFVTRILPFIPNKKRKKAISKRLSKYTKRSYCLKTLIQLARKINTKFSSMPISR